MRRKGTENIGTSDPGSKKGGGKRGSFQGVAAKILSHFLNGPCMCDRLCFLKSGCGKIRCIATGFYEPVRLFLKKIRAVFMLGIILTLLQKNRRLENTA